MTHSKMRLIVASNNSNKLREFREILGERFDIVSMHEAGIDADIEENGTTFEENRSEERRAAAPPSPTTAGLRSMR